MQSVPPRVIRARAPLRLGLAGGGSDVSPYADEYGGCVLNVTIDRYATATAESLPDGEVVLHAADLDVVERLTAAPRLNADEGLRLHRGVYNRMVREFNGGRPAPVRLTTHVDSPMGSGLGSSSALVVAMVAAMGEYLSAPLGEYDVARLAFEIERIELGLNGGKQDQYAAAFGGFNFMEFGPGERVVVNPLRIRASVSNEVQASLVLFFTGASRESARIIDQQSDALRRGGVPLDAMHQLKQEAILMKEALLHGDHGSMAGILSRGWAAKKRTSSAVSNPEIERLHAAAMDAGARAGKVSGAGGGGFLMFIVDPVRRTDVIRALTAEPGGRIEVCGITHEGVVVWRGQPSTSRVQAAA